MNPASKPILYIIPDPTTNLKANETVEVVRYIVPLNEYSGPIFSDSAISLFWQKKQKN